MLSKVNNSQLKNHLKSGLQAVKNSDKAKIRLSNSRNLQGSIDIDDALKDSFPNDNRWDYLVFNNSNIEGYFIEIHPAHTSEVKTMIKKKEWLTNKIINIYFTNIPSTKYKIIWIASGKNAILKSSKEYKLLSKYNLQPLKGVVI